MTIKPFFRAATLYRLVLLILAVVCFYYAARYTPVVSSALGEGSLRAAISDTLVINEIDYDQGQTDDAEFIELKNVSGGAINLAAYEIHLVNGFNNELYRTLYLPDIDLVAGGYYVICGNATTVENCDLDVTPDENLIQNGPPDAAALVLSGSIIDAVSYEGDTGAPYVEGSGVGLEDDPAIEYAGISRYPDGVDTDSNNQDFSLRCNSPGEINDPARRYCVAPPTPTRTPLPSLTNTPPAGATNTATPFPTPLPPTSETTLTPSLTPTPSVTPTATDTPFPPTPTPAFSLLPLLKIPFVSQEPNGNAAQANGPIPSGETVYGSFTPGDQLSDYYYFDLDYPYTIQAELTNIPPGHDYDVVIRDAAMNAIGYSGEYSNRDESALTVMVFPARYYIQVYNWSATYTYERYQLLVTYIWTP